MTAGKSSAQACHAARLSLLRFLEKHPERGREFLALNSVGTVVVLDAPDLPCLQKMAVQAAAKRLPWAMFVDSGHVMPPAFDGSPVVTALAIGPATKDEIRSITRNLRCVGERPTTGKINYVVEYTYYQYNSGAADNGCYTRQWPTKTAAEALSLADKINLFASNRDDDNQQRDDLQEEMIPYAGYFMSAKALQVTSEPIHKELNNV